MSALAITSVDLARIQFATTSLYHFLFVPLTLGLAPLVAVMQTLWHRSGDEAWLKLTRFFGTLLLINFAIGVATGLVQEFQFGMNWSVYSKYVGDVFGAPLAIEGLAAFFLEATFLGLWIFGWNRLPPRVHLATIWIVALGTWLSAYFILVANSWMQHPVAYEVSDGKAQLTGVWSLLTSKFALWAFGHTMLVGLTTASMLVFGIACWHIARGRDTALFLRAAKLALIVAGPGVGVQPLVRQQLRHRHDAAAADEDRGERSALGHRAARVLLAVPDRRIHDERPDAVVLDRGAAPALVPRDRLVQGQGRGDERAPEAGGCAVRARELHPARPNDLLGHADHGVPGHARLRGRGARRAPVLAAAGSSGRGGSCGPRW